MRVFRAEQFPGIFGLILVGAFSLFSCGSPSKNGGGNNSPSAVQPQAAQNEQTNSVAKTGSTARFTVLRDRLYAISGGGLVAFDLTVPERPTRRGFSAVSGDIETLFNDGEKLFIGAESAVFVYSVEDPNQPKRVGRYGHIRSCDPVVTSGTNAFVTLRSDQLNCRGSENVLKVIDFKEPTQPIEISSVPMKSPAGLGVSGNRLFVCDGANGLFEFNVSDPGKVTETAKVRDENCFDVIPQETSVITTGVSGVSQYDIKKANLIRISRIGIED